MPPNDTLHYTLYAGTIVLCSALVWLAARVSRRLAWGALGVGTVLAVALFATHVSLLSRPRPLAWSAVGEATVLGAKIIEGRGIYLLLDEGGEPRYYVMGWDRRRAEELQDALRSTERDGTALRFSIEPSLDDRDPMFHPAPQPALPLKLQPPDVPLPDT